MNVGGKELSVRGWLVRRAALAADGYVFVDDPAAAIAELGARRHRVDLFTFAQELPDIAPLYPYPMEWDNVAAVPVSTFEHWCTRQIKDKTRNRLRHAWRSGVMVREVPFDDVLVRGIAAIYNESAARQGRRFKHHGKPLDAVRRENATFLDQSVFLGAFLGDELIGFAKLVKARRQAGFMQIIAKMAHRDKSPTNALVASAVAVCEQHGMPYLVYGRFSYGRSHADPLSDFKRHNGFQRVDVPRYHVPLTVVGCAALRFGWHRGVRASVPEPLRERFRTLRAWWSRHGPAARASA